MDYKNVVGESITRFDGVHGVITAVDQSGAIHLKYDDDSFSGGYLYDPFLNEDAFFDNEELQKQIDDKITLITQTSINLIKQSVAKSLADEKYYITKNNADGSVEKVYSLNCGEQTAYRVFCHVIYEQQREQRRLQNKWRVIRLFDALSGKQIAIES